MFDWLLFTDVPTLMSGPWPRPDPPTETIANAPGCRRDVSHTPRKPVEPAQSSQVVAYS